MTKISPPSRGQPLDVTYIYQLANAVNDLSDSISTATYNYTSVDVRNGGREDIKNSNAKFYATFKDIVTNETVSANTTRSFSVDFASYFKYPPIVVATPINSGTSAVGNDVTVTLTSITSSRVEGVVRFNSSGSVTTSVHLIAIGLPA